MNRRPFLQKQKPKQSVTELYRVLQSLAVPSLALLGIAYDFFCRSEQAKLIFSGFPFRMENDLMQHFEKNIPALTALEMRLGNDVIAVDFQLGDGKGMTCPFPVQNRRGRGQGVRVGPWLACASMSASCKSISFSNSALVYPFWTRIR